MTDKVRLDVYLAEKQLIESREKAKAYIMAGSVYVDGRKADKPSVLVNDENKITIKEPDCAFVSRGGKKLQKALEVFPIHVKDTIAIDIGASTGGFTDCLLQHGAQKVYAVDVGYGQLDWRLRNDSRVVVMERQNARYLTPDMLADVPDICVTDVSFISLKLILPVARTLLKPDGEIVALIKPQFEAGREQVGKRGVVRDPEVHIAVVSGIVDFASGIGLELCGLDFSPIKGPNGNIEFIAYFKKKEMEIDNSRNIREIVLNAHNVLKDE